MSSALNIDSSKMQHINAAAILIQTSELWSDDFADYTYLLWFMDLNAGL